MTTPIYCKEFCRRAEIQSGCCDSCHEDFEEYGYDLIEIYGDEVDAPAFLANGEWARICCEIYNAYQSAHVTPPRPVQARERG